jgi:peptidylprolyl isomerase
MQSFLKQIAPVAILLAVCAALIGGMVWLFQIDSNSNAASLTSTETLPAPLTAEELAAYNVDMSNNNNPVAVLETNYGTIEIELFENQMPITAGNFRKLISEGYYDGTQFHRVIEGFMIQGGDPITKTDEVLRYGTGGPGYTIPDEHIKGDKLTNQRGTISMANSGPESGGSQFFINLTDNSFLDFDKAPLASKHPVFGQVVAGMDVVDAIAVVETNPQNLPMEPVTIESATIRE